VSRQWNNREWTSTRCSFSRGSCRPAVSPPPRPTSECRSSTVSRKVSELEERLKSRLLQRTTRKLSLTDVGRTYYDYARESSAKSKTPKRAVSSLEEAPRGLLRVTAPGNAAFLGTIVSDFLNATRKVGSNCFARRAPWTSSRNGSTSASARERSRTRTLIARGLGSVGWFLVASPSYLKKVDVRGHPRT